MVKDPISSQPTAAGSSNETLLIRACKNNLHNSLNNDSSPQAGRRLGDPGFFPQAERNILNRLVEETLLGVSINQPTRKPMEATVIQRWITIIGAQPPCAKELLRSVSKMEGPTHAVHACGQVTYIRHVHVKLAPCVWLTGSNVACRRKRRPNLCILYTAFTHVANQ